MFLYFQRRATTRRNKYFYNSIDGTPFSLGLAIPEGYGMYELLAEQEIKHSQKNGKEYRIQDYSYWWLQLRMELRASCLLNWQYEINRSFRNLFRYLMSIQSSQYTPLSQKTIASRCLPRLRWKLLSVKWWHWVLFQA